VVSTCFNPTPLKNDEVKVSWDEEITNYYGKNVPNHQSVMDLTMTNSEQ
jgi:hypothetical protein